MALLCAWFSQSHTRPSNGANMITKSELAALLTPLGSSRMPSTLIVQVIGCEKAQRAAALLKEGPEQDREDDKDHRCAQLLPLFLGNLRHFVNRYSKRQWTDGVHEVISVLCLRHHLHNERDDCQCADIYRILIPVGLRLRPCRLQADGPKATPRKDERDKRDGHHNSRKSEGYIPFQSLRNEARRQIALADGDTDIAAEQCADIDAGIKEREARIVPRVALLDKAGRPSWKY